MGNVIKWDSLMKSALMMPGIKIDRNAFLLSCFSSYGNAAELISKRPSDIYDSQTIEKVARGIVNNHTTKVTAISTAAGIPGGLAMLGTVPADLAQYYWHYLVMAQKLAYVYGWPDLRDDNNNLGEQAQAIMTLFVGIGFGVEGAVTATRAVAKKAAEYWAKKIPQMVLMKTSWYPIVKKVAGWLGWKLTKKSIGKSVGKIIPLLGGVISGCLTFATFKPMANKLKKVLSENQILFLNTTSESEDAITD